MKYLVFSFFILGFVFTAWGQNYRILMFVSHQETYYSEYVVMYQALTASGCTVDVYSSATGNAGVYGNTINAEAASLAGSNYAQFTYQFQNMCGVPWNAAWNAVPASIPVMGRIQDVADLSNYDAMVIPGGTGALLYRVDGSYSGHGSATAGDVQQSAEKLNALALEALQNGKPVLAQCHGASLPVFWRVPSTSGAGAEALGYSFLKDALAAGYPDVQTGTDYASLNVTYRANDPVIISSPHSSLNTASNGDFHIITSRDWYPQTVLYAARTLLNVLQTYPATQQMSVPVNVLILHGGVIDSTNCIYTNLANDVPCNYGTGANLPADYTQVFQLLATNSANDVYQFNVSELNLTGTLPFDANSGTSVLTYLQGYDVVVFFKHWYTGLTDSIERGIIRYADAGGGVLAMHHGLYNHNGSKDLLAQELFRAQSNSATWNAHIQNYNAYHTNYGHFVTTYGLVPESAVQAPGAWGTVIPPVASSLSFSYYHRTNVTDEIYDNMAFEPGTVFGNGVNQIFPVLSNDATPSAQMHTTGFTGLFDPTLNGSVGRLAYYEIGERRNHFSHTHPYGRIIRNTVVWLANKQGPGPTGVQPNKTAPMVIYPNPATYSSTLRLPYALPHNATLYVADVNGRIIQTWAMAAGTSTYSFDVTAWASGLYSVMVISNDYVYRSTLVVNK